MATTNTLPDVVKKAIKRAGDLHDRYNDEYEYEKPAEYNTAFSKFATDNGAIGTLQVRRRRSTAVLLVQGKRYRLEVTGRNVEVFIH